jgi:phenylalanyl-tRNA synthetase beta chain
MNLAMVKALGIEGKVYAGIFAILPEKIPPRRPRPPLCRLQPLPAALRDLALVVDGATPSDKCGRNWPNSPAPRPAKFALENVNPFDVYQGEGFPEGKKSLAFSWSSGPGPDAHR